MPFLTLFMHLAGRGCCSTAKPVETPVAEILKGPQVTERQKQLVTETWNLVNGDLAAVGDLFYGILFEMVPALRTTVFKGVNMVEQPKRLMAMVDAAVKMLNKPIDLVAVLRDSGKRHVKYGTKEAHYPVVGQAIIATLRKGLGAKLTKEAEEAWVAVYTFIAHWMIEGHHDFERTVTKAETKTAQKAWAELRRTKNMKTVGQQYYRRLFEMAPSLTTTLFKHVDMEVQPTLVMGMVGQVVDELDRPDIITYLRESGRRHIKYGSLDAHYAVVQQALLETLEKNLGAAWTPEVAKAMDAVYEFMAYHMIAGARASRK